MKKPTRKPRVRKPRPLKMGAMVYRCSSNPALRQKRSWWASRECGFDAADYWRDAASARRIAAWMVKAAAWIEDGEARRG